MVRDRGSVAHRGRDGDLSLEKHKGSWMTVSRGNRDELRPFKLVSPIMDGKNQRTVVRPDMCS